MSTPVRTGIDEVVPHLPPALELGVALESMPSTTPTPRTFREIARLKLKPTREYRRTLSLKLEHNPYSNRLELRAGVTIGKQHESVAFATAPLKEWTLRIDGDCLLHVLGGGLFSITLGEFAQIEHLLAPHGLKVVRS